MACIFAVAVGAGTDLESDAVDYATGKSECKGQADEPDHAMKFQSRFHINLLFFFNFDDGTKIGERKDFRGMKYPKSSGEFSYIG